MSIARRRAQALIGGRGGAAPATLGHRQHHPGGQLVGAGQLLPAPASQSQLSATAFRWLRQRHKHTGCWRPAPVALQQCLRRGVILSGYGLNSVAGHGRMLLAATQGGWTGEGWATWRGPRTHRTPQRTKACGRIEQPSRRLVARGVRAGGRGGRSRHKAGANGGRRRRAVGTRHACTRHASLRGGRPARTNGAPGGDRGAIERTRRDPSWQCVLGREGRGGRGGGG